MGHILKPENVGPIWDIYGTCIGGTDLGPIINHHTDILLIIVVLLLCEKVSFITAFSVWWALTGLNLRQFNIKINDKKYLLRNPLWLRDKTEQTILS